MSSLKLKHSGGNSVSLNPPSSAPTSSEVAFKLPTADGSSGQVLQTDGSGNLSWVTLPTAGITMADQWRRTADVSLNNSINYLTTDWERVDGDGQGTITGSGGMTESGGIFTFPSTGIYKVEWGGYFFSQGSSATISAQIHVTTDNSSYNRRAININCVPNISSYTYGYVACQTLVDVTDTSNVKVKLAVSSESATTLDTSSSENKNSATFIRLGDT